MDVLTNERTTSDRVIRDVRDLRLSFVNAETMKKQAFYNKHDWIEFADCWNNLKLDSYMGDKGTYRLRRYGMFKYISSAGTIELQPHTAYSQPGYVNVLNGDIERHYEPLETRFVSNPFFNGLMIWISQALNHLENQTGDWEIRILPNRILAKQGIAGEPTPEGHHRDGVDYVTTLLANRHNVEGGETLFTSNDGKELFRQTLKCPLDFLIANDEQTMHGVTSICRKNDEEEGYRDMLISMFTRPLATVS